MAVATVKIDYGIEEVLAAEFLMGSSLGHAAVMGKGAVLCTAKEPGFVSDGYHLDQVTHRQKAHDLVVLRHCKVANPFLSHEPTGIASAVIFTIVASHEVKEGERYERNSVDNNESS